MATLGKKVKVDPTAYLLSKRFFESVDKMARAMTTAHIPYLSSYRDLTPNMRVALEEYYDAAAALAVYTGEL